MRDGAPFILVIVPFSLLFGVVATEAGLNVLETMSFSVLVIAGAAQFTALQLLTDGAPTLIALVSALAVNLRMAMYSASLTPWIGEATLGQRAAGADLPPQVPGLQQLETQLGMCTALRDDPAALTDMHGEWLAKLRSAREQGAMRQQLAELNAKLALWQLLFAALCAHLPGL